MYLSHKTSWLTSLGRRKGSSLLATDQQFLDTMLGPESGRVQTVNLHHLALANRDQTYREAIDSATWITADGWPVKLVFSALGYEVERVTGYDFIDNLLQDERTQTKRLGLLGASAETGSEFETKLTQQGHSLVFRDHRSRTEWDIPSIAADLAAQQVDLLLVAVSPPHGDLIASSLIAAGYTGTVVSVGGAIEVTTGHQKTGPELVEKLGLVWLYRLLTEPKRLFSRYVFECLPVMLTVVLPIILSGPSKP